eukprot:4189894-Pyramimonas_sp.AAC.1
MNRGRVFDSVRGSLQRHQRGEAAHGLGSVGEAHWPVGDLRRLQRHAQGDKQLDSEVVGRRIFSRGYFTRVYARYRPEID